MSGASDGGLLLDSIPCRPDHNRSSFEWEWYFVAIPLCGELISMAGSPFIWFGQNKLASGMCSLWKREICGVCVESVLTRFMEHVYCYSISLYTRCPETGASSSCLISRSLPFVWS